MKNFTRELNEIDDLAVDAGWIAGPFASPAGVAEAAQRFELVDVTDLREAPALVAAWREMLSRGASPEKLYQTPEFFRYMVESQPGVAGAQVLYAVRRRADGAYVGIVPVRPGEQDVSFGVGPLRFATRTLATLQVLGSVPLLDRNEPGLAGFVHDSLLRLHPACRVLAMQAVPAAQVAALDDLPGLSAHVHNGVRACHTVPLPDSFDAYLQKFSSKKRYNLSRQVRLLGTQAGELQLCRIESPQQVPHLIEAMRAMMPAHVARPGVQLRFERMAAQGLLHSYVLRCGAEDVAVIVATRSFDVWHVHNIAALAKYQALSAGTSAVHLALQDLITHFSFADADFGYGSPNQEFRATHVLKNRCTVLVCQARSPTAALLAVHGLWQRAADALIVRVKQARARMKQRALAARKAPAPAA